MCQYDTDVPDQRPSSPARRHFTKKKKKKGGGGGGGGGLKRAVTLITLVFWKLQVCWANGADFTLNRTWPIFYDYMPAYKIWIEYNNLLFKKNIERKTFFEGEKGP